MQALWRDTVEFFPILLGGVALTIIVTLGSLLLSTVLGLVWALMRVSGIGFLSKLSAGLINVKLRERRLRDRQVNIVQPGEIFTLGKIGVEFFRVALKLARGVRKVLLRALQLRYVLNLCDPTEELTSGAVNGRGAQDHPNQASVST